MNQFHSTANKPPASKPPAIKDVMSALTGIKSWWHLAHQLGISQEKFYTFRSQDPLRETIKYWIEKGDPSPTWNKLVNALEHCGETKIAANIRQKYIKVNIVRVQEAQISQYSVDCCHTQ